MDAPVVAAIITGSVALVVSLGSAAATVRARRSDRRRDEVRSALYDAQNKMGTLRSALRVYGAALEQRAAGDEPSVPAPHFRLDVPGPLDSAAAAAESEFGIAVARVSDPQLAGALTSWLQAAHFGLLDAGEPTAARERELFDAVNRAIGAALRADG